MDRAHRLAVRASQRTAAALLLCGLSTAGLGGVAVGSSPSERSCSESPSGAGEWRNLGLEPPEAPPGVASPPRFEVRRVVLDPAGANRLWVATSHGLFRSEDGGSSWQLILTGVNGVFGLAVSAQFPPTVLASDYQAIYRSTDGGDTFSRISARFVTAIAFNPADPAVVYAGSSYVYLGLGFEEYGRLYASRDGGVSWLEPDPSFRPFRVWDLIVDQPSPGIALAATHFGIFRSYDQGQSWTLVNTPETWSSATALAFDPNVGVLVSTTSDFFFNTTTRGSILRSSDQGNHFETLVTVSGLDAIASHPLSATLYAGGSHGIIRSLDGGATWSAINDGLTDLFVTVLTAEPRSGSVFAGTRSGGLFKMTMPQDRTSRCRPTRVLAPRP